MLHCKKKDSTTTKTDVDTTNTLLKWDGVKWSSTTSQHFAFSLSTSSGAILCYYYWTHHELQCCVAG